MFTILIEDKQAVPGLPALTHTDNMLRFRIGASVEISAESEGIINNSNTLIKGEITAIEPVFDLFSKVLGTTQNQKQLPIQGLAKVRTFLSLGVLAVQIAMIVNHIWRLPLRQIAHILTVFS